MCLGAGVFLAVAQGSSPAPTIPYPSSSGPALPEAAVEEWSLRKFGAAARAYRSAGVAGVRSVLDGNEKRGSLLLGLYADQQGEAELALEMLGRGGDPSGLLEDWRLYRLSELLIEGERLPAARAALERLLATQADSPLYRDAYRAHLEITHRQGDWLATLRGIEAARQNGLAAGLGVEIDQLEWTIASENELQELRLESARRLLSEHPISASELKVVEIFRRQDGELDWREILNSERLQRRASRLLDGGITQGALATLDALPEANRDLDWSLLRAKALTSDRRGAEALEVLAGRPPTPPDRMPEVRRARAFAALEAATVRSRRTNATTDERRRLRDVAWNDLWQLANGEQPSAQSEALRELYKMADIEEDFELGLDLLRRLRVVDAADVTGYRDLFKLGWREFDRRNRTGAIGIWRELQDLYPETTRARQALYWSGVAHWELGNEARGRELLGTVLESDTIDFYSRHAAQRLGVTPNRRLEAGRDAWPDDPLLARAALLSELGLDGLAATELELLAEASKPRAALGLEALILARQGERRKSIQAIWQAFQSLGKPGQSVVPELVRQLYYPAEHSALIKRWAMERGLPPYLVFGIIRQESAFDADAVSRAGARGLMQLMPATGRELAGKLRVPFSRSRLNDPEYSLQLGTRYFSQVLDLFDGDVELALAGYNGGPYRIRRWWREAGPTASVDRFVEGLALTETTNYVKRILIHQDSYEELYGDSG